jgi:hypothetical protein
MKNREMVALVRKSGNVYMPVLTKTDVLHIRVVKSDLIAELEQQDLDKECAWAVLDRDPKDNSIILDVA